MTAPAPKPPAPKPKVVITNWVHENVRDYLSQHCTVVANGDRSRPFTREHVIASAPDAVAILAFMPDWVDDSLLRALPNLRIVAGALKGYDNFDVDACSRHGIWLTIVPDLLTEPTAELAIGLMIALGRNIPAGDRFVRSGTFAGWRPRFYGSGLAGSTVVIVGMGAVGQAIARRLTGFGASVLYVDNHALPVETETALMVRRRDLADAVGCGDYVVLALPLSADTARLFDADRIRTMKPGSLLVNPGRGSLVDEEAVADALADGHLAGYAADVFEMEDWVRPGRRADIPRRLLDDPDHTCLTPHIGSAVDRVRRDIAVEAARNIVQVLHGERPVGAVNDIGGVRCIASL